ncbi:hypothetical protein Hanom_Chr11g00989591 [Helianthus anomalus]
MVRASFPGVVLILRISIEIFYIYYVWPGLVRAFFSARVFRPWHVQRARSATSHLYYIFFR